MLGKADVHGKEGFLQCVFSHGKSHTARRKTKLFSCPCTPTPFHAPGIMAQKIKVVSSRLFHRGYFCMWEGEGSALVPRSPLSLPSLPQLPAMDGGAQGRLPLFFCPSWLKQHSHPFTTGQQGNVPVSPASELPS